MLPKNLRSVVAQVNHGRRSISTRSIPKVPSSRFTPESKKRTGVFVTSVFKGILGYAVWDCMKLIEYGRTMERALDERSVYQEELAAKLNAVQYDVRELFRWVFYE